MSANAHREGAKKLVTGVLQVTRRPVGYLAWPLEMAQKDVQDIEVETQDLGGALNGDTVEVELTAMFPRPKGKVVRIETRAKTEFVCVLRKSATGSGLFLAIPDDQKFYFPIRITKAPEGAEANMKVLVRLTECTSVGAIGEAIALIGREGEHRTEMNSIVLEHGFQTEFPEQVRREAEALEKNHEQLIAEEATKRADYRGVTTFTIDPKDAKDFDDALSIKELENDEYEIGIHIADVTFFVRPETPLDTEAIHRGTSVYLVDATIPMLPHELSGNICSLKEGVDRLVFSAVFRMNKKGEVLDRRFEKSVINSNRRFTYEEAQEILDNEKGAFVEELLVLRDIARIMRRHREKEGAIDFGDNEVRFELDENGKPLRVIRKQRIETNLLIEEFMLLANREVALYVSKLAEKVPESKYVFLYRIHDDPKPDRIEDLAVFLRAMGYEFGTKKKKYTAKDIQKLLEDIKGTPEEHLIRTATLRSMAKAIYSTKNIGHFGLAFKYYTHFTSPIRRYPDMLVHRILASHLPDRQAGLNKKPITRTEYTKLERMCLDASAREAEAVSAERESIRYKQVEYMLNKVGKEFDAVISGVTDWGIYVEEKETAAEGLVRMRSIGDDFYTHSPKEYALVGQRTKKKHTLGDKVRVTLTAADLHARTLDFTLVK